MPPKRKSPVIVPKKSPNKKPRGTEDKAPPPPVAVTQMNLLLKPEQLKLATTTFEILIKDKMVILVGKDDYPGCAKTMVMGEAIRLYMIEMVRSSRRIEPSPPKCCDDANTCVLHRAG